MSRTVCSWKFYVAMILPFLFLIVGSIDELRFWWDRPNYTDVFNFVTYIVPFGSFTTMMILAACFPHSSSYCDDVRQQYSRLMLPRCRERNYCLAKIITGSITGGVAASVGLLLFILFLRVQFPLVLSDSSMVNSYIIMRETHYCGELLYNEMYIGFFAAYVFSAFCFGAICGALGITVSGFLPNPFVAMFVPFLLIQITEIIPVHLIGSWLLRPRHVLNGSFNIGGWGGSLAYTALFTFSVIMLCCVLFRLCVKRRLRNE